MAENQETKKLSPETVKTVVAVVMFCGVLGFAYWKFLWKPYSFRKTEAVAKIEKINGEITKAIGMTKRLEPLNIEIAELTLREADAEKRLPKGRRLPDMIRSLVDLARDNGLSINTISPQATREKPFYVEVPYAISITGGYHSIGKFLATLASSQRVFTIRDMNISSVNGGAQAVFVLTAYQYKG